MSDYDPARHIPFVGGADEVSISDWHVARAIAREWKPPEVGDAVRWAHDADRIRRALALPTYRDHTIEMSCFNREDVEQIQRRLTADELQRVTFRWMVFPGATP